MALRATRAAVVSGQMLVPTTSPLLAKFACWPRGEARAGAAPRAADCVLLPLGMYMNAAVAAWLPPLRTRGEPDGAIAPPMWVVGWSLSTILCRTGTPAAVLRPGGWRHLRLISQQPPTRTTRTAAVAAPPM